MTVYERLKSMTEEELGQFILTVYQWGHVNERCAMDDSWYYKRLMTGDQSYVDDIVNDYDKYGRHLHKIKVSNLDGGDPHYVSTRFYSVCDATEYIHSHCRCRDEYGISMDVTKITDYMYIYRTKLLTIEED